MLLKILKKPYPFEESINKRLLISIAFGLFIGLFLLFFQPFDIQDIKQQNKELYLLGFGLVTFIALLFTYLMFPLIFKRFYNFEKWTAGKEIIHISFNIFLIAVLNIIYASLFCENCISYQADFPKVILYSFLTVLSIGLFPVTFMVLIYQNILLKRNFKKAESINSKIKVKPAEQNIIKIYSNNKKNILSLASSQLLAIEANGNYINVYYKDNDKLKREVIRNTLKKAENTIEKHTNFVRCHKSYIVNLANLKKVTGNAQGYKLELDQIDFQIPVSRNFSKKILEIIQD